LTNRQAEHNLAGPTIVVTFPSQSLSMCDRFSYGFTLMSAALLRLLGFTRNYVAFSGVAPELLLSRRQWDAAIAANASASVESLAKCHLAGVLAIEVEFPPFLTPYWSKES
jgi:hypothetical protein